MIRTLARADTSDAESREYTGHSTDQEDLDSFELSTYCVSVSVLSTGNTGRNKKNEGFLLTEISVTI